MFIHTRGMASLDSSLAALVQNDKEIGSFRMTKRAARSFEQCGAFRMTEGCGCSGRRGMASLDSSLAALVQNDKHIRVILKE